MTKPTLLIAHILFFGCVQAFLVSLLFRQNVHPPVPKVVRIAFLPEQRLPARLSPYGPGFDRELILYFCRRQGLTPEWLPVKSARQGITALQKGRADILVRSMAATFQTLPADLQSGPVYRVDHPVIVHNKWKEDLLHPEDLCTNTPLLAPGPVFKNSLQTLTRTLDCAPENILSQNSTLGVLLSRMTETRTRFALVGASHFKLWQPFFPDIRPTLKLHQTFGPAWVWRAHAAPLAEQLQQFWQETPTSSFFLDLQARYFGFFPAKTDYYELDHLKKSITRKLPRYSKTIRNAAHTYNLDPLLLTAMIYQESHFDPQATSKTGVRGLLQISRATARELGITNRLLPTASIMGGARYLRSIMDRLAYMDLDPWNTLFFALSAYNQGMGHLKDAVNLAKHQGKDGRSWREVKKVFPLLSYRKYYTKTEYGYCRGIEAVDYVESIRYYYYYLTGLLHLERPAGQKLTLLTRDKAAKKS